MRRGQGSAYENQSTVNFFMIKIFLFSSGDFEGVWIKMVLPNLRLGHVLASLHSRISSSRRVNKPVFLRGSEGIKGAFVQTLSLDHILSIFVQSNFLLPPMTFELSCVVAIKVFKVSTFIS